MPGFSFVLATVDGFPVGQTFGWPLQRDTDWWRGLQLDQGQPPIAEFTAEDGTRTFGFSELMVDEAHTGCGIASKLFRTLMAEQPLERATWLVNPANEHAYAIYRHWGARKIGSLQPGWEGAPRFDVLVVDLPLPPE
jgi:hypothetical protein